MMKAAVQGIRQPHSTHGRYAWVLLAPALLMAILLFIVPMSAIVASSFSESPASHSFTFANYLAVVTDGFYWQILLRTIRISVVATIVGLIVCYPAALHIYFSSGKWRQIFLLVVISPLLVSSVVRTFGWIVVMSPNGALNSVVPGGLPFQLLYSETGVMIGLIHIQVPIVVLSLNASLSKLDKRLLSAASSLGASNYQILRDVIIPLSFPGLIAASTIMFVTSMTAFAIPILLGGSQTKTAAFVIYQLILLVSDWHVGSAFALFLVLMTMSLVFLFTRVARALLPQAAR